MNLSGQSIGAARKFFKVEPGDLLVVHDDVDLILEDQRREDVLRVQWNWGNDVAGGRGTERMNVVVESVGSASTFS